MGRGWGDAGINRETEGDMKTVLSQTHFTMKNFNIKESEESWIEKPSSGPLGFSTLAFDKIHSEPQTSA